MILASGRFYKAVTLRGKAPGVLSASRGGSETTTGRAGIVLPRVCFIALMVFAHAVMSEASPFFVQQGKAGFVVSHFEYALSLDAEETGACPDGMSLQVEEIFKKRPEGQRRPGESDDDYQQRLREARAALSTLDDGRNVCMHPELAEPDPHFRKVETSDIPVYGIPLDGAETFSSDPAQTFPGMEGEERIENQFYRAIGCNRSFQSTGQSNEFAIEMLTGAWGIVISLSRVDDIRNDDDVEVGIHANGDPIQLSPAREPLEYATYEIKEDPRFQATTRGRIKDGVLTTEPVDVRFRQVVNNMLLERPLRDARLKVTLSKDGVLEGYLAGYVPVEELYDYQFGYRNGKNPNGGPLAPGQPQNSANGAAHVLGYTCPGIYHALHAVADGHPDPETGKFTSVSTQYKIKAIPAFVIDDKANANAKRDDGKLTAGARHEQ